MTSVLENAQYEGHARLILQTALLDTYQDMDDDDADLLHLTRREARKQGDLKKWRKARKSLKKAARERAMQTAGEEFEGRPFLKLIFQAISRLLPILLDALIDSLTS